MKIPESVTQPTRRASGAMATSLMLRAETDFFPLFTD
jgi:hypothetical protein